MRITIVQSEIEDAIRDSILHQISVHEGMAIDITLRATRGAEGYQADIDIRPATAAPAEPEAVSEPETSKPLAIEETVTNAKRGGRRTATSTVTKTELPEEPGENKDPSDELTAESDEAPAGSEAEAEPAEGDAPKVASIFAKKLDEAEPAVTATGEAKSLFGGLKRPVNA